MASKDNVALKRQGNFSRKFLKIEGFGEISIWILHTMSPQKKTRKLVKVLFSLLMGTNLSEKFGKLRSRKIHLSWKFYKNLGDWDWLHLTIFPGMSVSHVTKIKPFHWSKARTISERNVRNIVQFRVRFLSIIPNTVSISALVKTPLRFRLLWSLCKHMSSSLDNSYMCISFAINSLFIWLRSLVLSSLRIIKMILFVNFHQNSILIKSASITVP